MNTELNTRPPRGLARSGRWLGPVALLILLAGCATGGGYGFPGQGQGQPYPGQPYPSDQYGGQYGSQSLTGTVDGVDLNGQRLVLITQSSGYGTGSRAEVYFDQNTRLIYQGQQHPIQGLERGDVVRVDAAQSGGRLWARTIEVVRNVRDGYGGDQYGGNELRGNVAYVDTRARTIELERGGSYGDSGRVRYDERTVVEYQGRRYRAEDLDRGDLVRIQVRRIGNELLAERILVERSVR